MSQSSQSPVRVGLVGYGFAGRTFHARLIGAELRLTLTAIASSDAGKVHADLPGIHVEADPLAVIAAPEIDLVVIATPNDSHAPLARAALEAGKHVVVDKPFTLDLAEARGLVALAKAQGRVLSVFHNRRWDSDFLTVRRAIADGLVGKVSHFESHIDRFRPLVRDRWRERAGPGTGLWFDLGPHLADQALQLFGLPDRVQASFARQRDGALSNDWAHVVLDYGEMRAVLHAGLLVAGGKRRFIVHGSGGSVIKHRDDQQESQLIAGLHPGDAGWGADDDDLVVFDAEGHERRTPAGPGDQRRYYASIAAQLLDGRTDEPVTAIQALAVMAVVEAATEAAQRHASVALPLTGEERAEWRRVN